MLALPLWTLLSMATSHGSLLHLLPPKYKSAVSAWLEEDCPTFDYGGFVVGEDPTVAKLFGKSEGVLAGVPFFDEVFRQLDCGYDIYFFFFFFFFSYFLFLFSDF